MQGVPGLGVADGLGMAVLVGSDTGGLTTGDRAVFVAAGVLVTVGVRGAGITRKVMVLSRTLMRHHRCRVLRHPDQADDQSKGAQDHQRQGASIIFLHQNLFQA